MAEPGHGPVCDQGPLPLLLLLLLVHLRLGDQPRVPRPERVRPGPGPGLRRQELHVRGLRRGARLLQLLQVRQQHDYGLVHNFNMIF